MGDLLCVILLFLLLLLSAAAATMTSSNILRLSPGFHLSMPPSFDNLGLPIFPNLTFTVAIPTLDQTGLFFPINPSSPSFFSTDSSSSSQLFGFSLGLYVIPSQSSPLTHLSRPCSAHGCNIYLAVCAGSSVGSTLTFDQYISVSLDGALQNVSKELIPYKTLDGFAAPTWIANLDSPIRYADQASLMVELVADSKGSSAALELQLREGEKVVWRVLNVDTMEMQDTGDLLIYNSSNRSHPVFRTNSLAASLALVEGQSLTVGRELVSNDSSYLARMEQGGLVFYMNKTPFLSELQPAPYWLFPLYSRDDPQSLDQLISSASCSNSLAYAEVNVFKNEFNYPGVALNPGSCSSNTSFLISSTQVDFSGYWILWRLEGDGMLYSYAISSPSGSPASVMRTPLDSYYLSHNNYTLEVKFTPIFLQWQDCNAPLACGPLGVCTPGAEIVCSCPEGQDFEPVNVTDPSGGCKRRIDLPTCTSAGKGQYTGSSDFIQLNSTASILLFHYLALNSTHAEVNVCEKLCSSECSCTGFIYQSNTSSCTFITDAIPLLRVVDVSYTSFQDPIRYTTLFASDYVTYLKVASELHNLTVASELRKSEKRRNSRLIALSVGLPSVLLVCLVLGMTRYLLRAIRRKKYVHNSMLSCMEESSELQDILPLLPRRFSYKHLLQATQGFSKLLGAGGAGSVYAGALSDGRKVAVKVLQAAPQGTRHSKQFLAEIASIGHTGHHNIVRLVGFCWEGWQRLLVYEYVERGSLDRWIFVREPEASIDDTFASVSTAPFLDWKTRYNVALGIARGLNYLHEECEQPILHFDIKPQNILLDNEFEAKLADFGMSRLIERDRSAVMTGMRGTPGYMAPEWCSKGTVSKKSDVYSMGMVFLEIVGGRKNLEFSLLNSASADDDLDGDEDDIESKEAWHFPSWAARKCEQGLIMELVDRRLHGCGFDAVEACRLIRIAFWCIQEDTAKRPNTRTVVQWLEGSSADVEQPPFSQCWKVTP